MILDVDKCTLTDGGARVTLARQHVNMIVAIAKSRSFICEYTTLASRLWPDDDEPEASASNMTDMASHIRSACRKAGASCPIETVRGLGYRAVASLEIKDGPDYVLVEVGALGRVRDLLLSHPDQQSADAVLVRLA